MEVKTLDQSKLDGIKKSDNIIERKRDFSDVSTVESQRDNLLPEEFPEGPYGSPINRKLSKDTPYLDSQRSTSAFTYEGKEFHEGLERHDPTSHPTNDNTNDNEETMEQ